MLLTSDSQRGPLHDTAHTQPQLHIKIYYFIIICTWCLTWQNPETALPEAPTRQSTHDALGSWDDFVYHMNDLHEMYFKLTL